VTQSALHRKACRFRSRAGFPIFSPHAWRAAEHFIGNLRLLRYRPLFSGPAVERIAELQFQRPEPELALAPEEAARRQIADGDVVSARSNGTSVALRARIDGSLAAGVARIAAEHTGDLHRDIEVLKA